MKRRDAGMRRRGRAPVCLPKEGYNLQDSALAVEAAPCCRIHLDIGWLLFLVSLLLPTSNAFSNNFLAPVRWRHEVLLDKARHHQQSSTQLLAKGGRTDQASKPTQSSESHGVSSPKRNEKLRNLNIEDRAIVISDNHKKLIECETSSDVLTLLASIPGVMTRPAGGRKLDSSDFSTAIHRIARHLQYSRDNRAKTLSDPRFALLLCSLSEAMVGYQDVDEESSANKLSILFSSLECSKVAWALAKLRLAPPRSTLDVNLKDTVMDELVQSSFEVRTSVLEAARNRNGEQPHQKHWIPALSLVAGKLLDIIALSTLKFKTVFNAQEMSNLLRAFATTHRSDKRVFDHIAAALVQDDLQHQLKPQELSNSIWAFAAAQIHGEGESNLIRCVADLLDERPAMVDDFNAQELSDTAWGIATIISDKRASGIGHYSPGALEEEDRVVRRTLRHISRSLAARADEFKSQELANTVWAFATLGFGMRKSQNSDKSTGSDNAVLQTDESADEHELMANALHAVAESALPRLPEFRSEELGNLAWAFAHLERKSSTELYEAIGSQFGLPRRKVSGQDVLTTLSAFASLEYFDEDVYRTIASQLTIEHANELEPKALIDVVWGLATAGVTPKYLDAFETSFLSSKTRVTRPDPSDDPITLCFGAAADELMKHPQQFMLQDINDVLWSFSKVGVRHPRLFETIAEYMVGPESVLVPTDEMGHDVQGIEDLSWSYERQAQLASKAADRIASQMYEESATDETESVVNNMSLEMENDTAEIPEQRHQYYEAASQAHSPYKEESKALSAMQSRLDASILQLEQLSSEKMEVTDRAAFLEASKSKLEDRVAELEARIEKVLLEKQAQTDQSEDQDLTLASLVRERDEAVASQAFLTEKLDSTMDDLESVRGQLEEVESEKREMSAKLNMLSASTEDLETRLEEATRQTQALATEKDSLLKARDALDAQVSKLRQDQERLSSMSKGEADKELKVKLMTLEYESYELRKILAEGKAEVAEAQIEAQAATDELQEQRSSLAEAARRQSDLENDLRKMKQLVKDAQREASQFQAEAQSSSETIRKKTTRLQDSARRQAELEHELRKTNNLLADANKNMTQLQDDVQASSKELQQTTKALQDSVSHRSKLEKKLRELSIRTANEKEKLESELDDLQEQTLRVAARMQEDVDRRELSESQLRRKTDKERAKASTEIKSLRSKVEQLQASLSEIQVEAAAAQQENEELQDQNWRLKAKELKAKVARESQDALRGKITSLSEKKSELQAEVESFREASISHGEHQREIEGMKAELGRVRAANFAAAQQGENLRAQLNQAQVEKEKSTADVMRMKQELSATIAALQNENHELHHQIRIQRYGGLS